MSDDGMNVDDGEILASILLFRHAKGPAGNDIVRKRGRGFRNQGGELDTRSFAY